MKGRLDQKGWAGSALPEMPLPQASLAGYVAVLRREMCTSLEHVEHLKVDGQKSRLQYQVSSAVLLSGHNSRTDNINESVI